MITYETLITRTKVGTELPLAYTPIPKTYRWITVAQLAVPDLLPGDFVHVTGHGQAATRDGITRAMHCRYLKATKTGRNEPSEGMLLARPMGCNFTDDQHYSLQDAAGSFVADASWSGTVTVQLVMYAAGLSGVADDPRSLLVSYAELRADIARIR